MNAATDTLTVIKGPRETRKFPRLTIPINVRVKDKTYPVFNWSVDGICMANIGSDIALGKAVDIGLLFNTGSGAIRVDLVAKVVWHNLTTKQCGMHFINPEPKKVALMNEVIDLNLSQYGKKSAGQTVGVAKGDQELTAFSSGRERMKRLVGLSLFAAIGIASVLFLGTIIYDRLFLFEASSASIFSEAVVLSSSGEGIIKSIVSEGSVKDGQVLAQIDLSSGGVAEVLSSCACETVAILKRNGSFVSAGEPIINLVKSDAKPVVSVRIPFHDLERVVKGASVALLYLDGTAIKGAKIKELTKITDDRSSFVTLYVEPGRALTPSQVGQPVYAVIDTGPL